MNQQLAQILINDFISSGARTGRFHGSIYMSRLQSGCSFYIESSRHPEYPGKKKHITYKTWEEAYAAHEKLLPMHPMIANLHPKTTKQPDAELEDDIDDVIDDVIEDEDGPITKEAFQDSIRNWTVCVAEAHARACEESSKDADYWAEMHKLMAHVLAKSHADNSNLILSR